MTDYFYDIDESSKEDEESSVDMEEILSAYEERAAEVMEENDLTPEYVEYELIYVDDDDIPECVAGFGGNSMLFTYKDGEVITLPEELFMNWSYIYYIERTGKIRYVQIASPYHWYYYYTLKDGEITLEETQTEPPDEEYDEYECCSVYMDDGYDDVWEAADAHGIEY